jgi:hypothetical protein
MGGLSKPAWPIKKIKFNIKIKKKVVDAKLEVLVPHKMIQTSS